MNSDKTPVYLIGVAAELCQVHPQTLRQYERLGLVVPARVGAKNRLYSADDIRRVRRIQRLTQDMGVNLAGVEIILKLQEAMDEMQADFEREFEEYVRQLETRLAEASANANAPVRHDGARFPVPRWKRRSFLDED
jgi:MerR family transcriptional regulator, heat shock protein HspR